MKIANKGAAAFVRDKKVFEGSNIFSEKTGDEYLVYVVYAYGYHFPMYVFYRGVWYENSDRYSPTTSRYQSQCRPHRGTVKMDTAQLKKLIDDAVSAKRVG